MRSIAASESAGVPSGPTEGDIDVDEVYGEIQIPILKDAPFADLLQVSAAIRWFDYSTFGSDTTTKFGLNWRPVKDLLLRGDLWRGFPCTGHRGAVRNVLALRCDHRRSVHGLRGPPRWHAATAGESRRIAWRWAFRTRMRKSTARSRSSRAAIPISFPRPPTATRRGSSIARAGLSGMSWSDALEFEFTYYKIEIDDTIQARDGQAKLNGCVESLDAVLCDGIARTPGGMINGFNNTLINIGGTDTSGYDLNLRWVLPATGVGRFTFSWQNTFSTSTSTQWQTATGFIEEAREGTERGSPSIAFPELKSALTADWTLGDFSAAATVRYTDAVTESLPRRPRRRRYRLSPCAAATPSRTRWTRRPTSTCRRAGRRQGLSGLDLHSGYQQRARRGSAVLLQLRAELLRRRRLRRAGNVLVRTRGGTLRQRIEKKSLMSRLRKRGRSFFYLEFGPSPRSGRERIVSATAGGLAQSFHGVRVAHLDGAIEAFPVEHVELSSGGCNRTGRSVRGGPSSQRRCSPFRHATGSGRYSRAFFLARNQPSPSTIRARPHRQSPR